MRLICPNCDAQYEVDDGAIPQGGRDVQCSNCGHAWFQTHADFLDDNAEDDDVPVVPEPPVAPVVEPDPPPVAVQPPAPAMPPPEPAEAIADTPTAAPGAPVRRTLDENLLTVLREEAAREAAERRAEAGRTIETQPELGPLDGGGRAAPPPPPPAAAMLPEEPDHPVTQRPNARRDLLPDIEEINSTLRPGSEARDDNDALPVPPPPPRGAFRTGFFSVILVALVLVILYTMAPQLADRFPGVAATLTAYVATVDGLRVWLDGVMKAAADGLRGLTGEG